MTIKSFLGTTPSKVFTSFHDLSVDERRLIKSLNIYLDKTVKPIDVPTIGTMQAEALSIPDNKPVIILKKDIYVPTRITLRGELYNEKRKNLRSCYYNASGMVYLKGLGKRPNLEHIFKHISILLSSEYKGWGPHIEMTGPVTGSAARYILCLDNATLAFLQTLLHIAIEGNGEVVDYTWIAPLQDLIETEKDRLEKSSLKKNSKVEYTPPQPFSGNNFGEFDMEEVGEDELNQVLDRHRQRHKAELVAKIARGITTKKSTWSAPLPNLTPKTVF